MPLAASGDNHRACSRMVTCSGVKAAPIPALSNAQTAPEFHTTANRFEFSTAREGRA
jgi:hypothetical protein